MKKLLILTSLIFILLNSGISQGCLPEGIYFQDQTQIDNFQTYYPNCTEIEGNVMIHGYNITNLQGLNQLTSIDGYLKIDENSSLTSLIGLDNLTHIGGDVEIFLNDLLVNLVGLNSLGFIGGDVDLFENNSMTSLSGLDNLSIIDGWTIIGSNSSLLSLSGLTQADSLKGGLAIWGNYSLNDLTGLDHISYIGKYLNIQSNDSIISLTGLENINLDSIIRLTIINNPSLIECEIENFCSYLENPVGKIIIYDNATGCSSPTEIANNCNVTLPCLPFGNYYFFNQNDIDLFQTNYPNCNDIGGDIQISGSDIANLDGLSIITSVSGSLVIKNNNQLLDFDELSNLISVGGNLEIIQNDYITNLTGFERLTYIASRLKISGNDGLETLQGLDSLVFIGTDLIINSNGNLQNINNLSNLRFIEKGIIFSGNNKVPNFIGLDSVKYINGNLEIDDSFSLLSLSGLDGLTRIGGDLILGYDHPWYGNSQLQSLDALINVTSIDGKIVIDNNHDLYSLQGLNNIDSESIEDLKIVSNQRLSTCEVQSICDYIANPNGSISIYGNFPGCNSQEEVEAACIEVSSPEYINTDSKINIFPNPATNELTISTDNETKVSEVTIYNQLGQVVLHQDNVNSKVDVSTLEPGIYIIEGVTEDARVREKLIIQ